MSIKIENSILIGVVFLYLTILIQASSGKLTCQLRYKTDSTIFNDFQNQSRITIPNEDWFVKSNISIVNLDNTRRNQTYIYNITEITNTTLNFSQSLET